MAYSGPMHGYMYEDRGEMVSTFIICYALSSAVAGYSSGSFYKYVIRPGETCCGRVISAWNLFVI